MSSRKPSTMSIRKPSTMSRNKSINSKKTKNYNVRKTTKSVFDQLIKSFGRIGNEAEKDSKLLKNASNKLT